MRRGATGAGNTLNVLNGTSSKLRGALRLRRVAQAGVLAGLLLIAAGCGGSKGDSSADDTSTGSTTLTIYSSLPMEGESKAQSMAIYNAQKLALTQIGSRLSGFTVKFALVDDSTAAEAHWNPGATSVNARKAAQDRTTIAYLGEGDSGASAVSIPILNEAGILQVSPTNAAVGLTKADGAIKGEPDKYYPSGMRNFGRVAPTNAVQAPAQIRLQQDNGCTKLYVLDDGDIDGKDLASRVAPLATRAGLTVVGSAGIDPKASNYRDLADETSAKGADCIFFGGATYSNAVQLWKDLHAGNPTAKLFGGAGLAQTAFTSRIGVSAADVTFITSPALGPAFYPPAGQKFFDDYRAEFDAEPEPAAIFGYESMAVVLEAIRLAGAKGNDRKAVVEAFFKIRNRRSVLGTYSVEESGDTTLTDYGAYRVRRGKLDFLHVLRPA